mgnify:FL=1
MHNKLVRVREILVVQVLERLLEAHRRLAQVQGGERKHLRGQRGGA